jgi:hypothetical protein
MIRGASVLVLFPSFYFSLRCPGSKIAGNFKFKARDKHFVVFSTENMLGYNSMNGL